MTFGRIKLFLGLIILGHLFLMSCATISEKKDKTIYSDLFPQQISRDAYYFELGLGYLNDSDLETAIDHFKLSLLHNPHNYLSKYWLAVSYFRRNQLNLAIIELEKLSDENFQTDSVLKLKSDIYEQVQSYEKVIETQEKLFFIQKHSYSLWKIFEMYKNLKNYNMALKTLKRLENTIDFKLNDKSDNQFKIHLATYEIFQNQKLHELALQELELAEKSKPLDSLTMHKIIDLQMSLKKWPELSKTGALYTKYHPFNEDISEKLSQAYIQTQQYDEAISELKKQKENDPKSIGIEFKIAHVLFLKKDFINAEDLYKELYEITKSDQSVFYISQIHLMQNDISKASSQLENLASWSEYYPNAQIQLARLEWKNNQYDLAMNRLRRSHLLRPDSLEIYQEYGQYLIWQKRFVESIALVEKGIKSYPNDDKLRLLAAYVHFKLNNLRSFKYQIDQATRINPLNSEIYSVLAELWYEKKKPYSELEYLAKKAIDLNSKNKNIKPLLAWALLQQDKLTSAVKLFEEFYDQNPNEVFYADSLAEIYNRNVLDSKKSEFEKKALALRVNQQLKSDLDYFKTQNELDHTITDDGGNRLPASLMAP